MKLTSTDFGAFFEAAHGNRPFAWQQELADRVCSGGDWPAALDVPTGLGKTAVLDVAVFALALQAELPLAQRSARTRTFLVVDRRVIVDQAYDRARRLVQALTGQDEIMVEVTRRLQLLAGPDAPPLTAARLRGGVSWSSRWLASPRLPALVTGTVDQLGSRLLFRGYGVTQTMRPVDAALCGNDSLLLLDEAHLSQAFLRTVRAVSAYEALADEPVLPGRVLRTVLLSATLPRPTDASLDDVHRCDPARETAPAARARLDAVKSTTLLDVKAKGDLAPVLADLAATAWTRGASRVGVVCNTVALARAVFERLAPDDGVDTALLIGRCREVERDRNAETWVRGRLAALEHRPDERPVIVVATQTIEVGADLDLDALVTEACPLDALTQRLGRLNRLGRAPSAQAVVVHDSAIHAPDAPVYGAATGRTWAWLTQQVAAAGGSVSVTAPAKAQAAVDGAVSIDLGAGGVLTGLSPDVRAGLATEPPLAPVVLGPVLDLWARTHPEPDPDQPVAPFLHGLVAPHAELQFCWRAGLSSAEQWQAELTSAPPAAHETVSVSYAEALRVLGRSRRDSRLSDVEGSALVEDVEDVEEAPGLGAWLVGRDQQVVPLEAATPLRPGATVVLPSSIGGHDEWGWTGVLGTSGDVAPVRDVADLGSTGPLRLRLRPEVWGHPAVEPAAWSGLDTDDRESVLTSLLEALRSSADSSEAGGRRVLAVLTDAAMRRRWTAAGPVVTAPRNGVAMDRDDGTEDTPVSSSRSPSSVALDRHLRDVERVGADTAVALGLSPVLVRTVALAGLAHDLGKADPRFQLLLHGGNRFRHELAVELLAKSGAPEISLRERQAVQERSGWPVGMRHEAVSMALLADLAKREPSVFDGVDTDLVLHLVGAHHGRGRPLHPPVVDDTPVQVTVSLPGSAPASVASAEAVLDWEQPARFALLHRRYGRWGPGTAGEHRAARRHGGVRGVRPCAEARAGDRMTRLVLTALRGGDSLGLLAALGLLALCEDGLGVSARLGWEGPDGAAVLDAPFADLQELATALGNLAAEWHAEERVTPATDPLLITAPLGAKARKALDAAGALDPMKMPATTAVGRFQNMQHRELQQRGADAGWLTALVGQLTAAKRDEPERRLTPLYSPSGQMTLRQLYRDTLETVRRRPVCLSEALSGWLRVDGTGANLDSRALIDAADASGGVAANRYVPGTTWLALQSASWFPQVGDGVSGEAVAWTYPPGGGRLRWPVWTPLLTPDAVRVLLAHPAVRGPAPRTADGGRSRQSEGIQERRGSERRVLGVCALYEARRRALTKSAGPLQPPVLLWQA